MKVKQEESPGQSRIGFQGFIAGTRKSSTSLSPAKVDEEIISQQPSTKYPSCCIGYIKYNDPKQPGKQRNFYATLIGSCFAITSLSNVFQPTAQVQETSNPGVINSNGSCAAVGELVNPEFLEFFTYQNRHSKIQSIYMLPEDQARVSSSAKGSSKIPVVVNQDNQPTAILCLEEQLGNQLGFLGILAADMSFFSDFSISSRKNSLLVPNQDNKKLDTFFYTSIDNNKLTFFNLRDQQSTTTVGGNANSNGNCNNSICSCNCTNNIGMPVIVKDKEFGFCLVGVQVNQQGKNSEVTLFNTESVNQFVLWMNQCSHQTLQSINSLNFKTQQSEQANSMQLESKQAPVLNNWQSYQFQQGFSTIECKGQNNTLSPAHKSNQQLVAGSANKQVQIVKLITLATEFIDRFSPELGQQRAHLTQVQQLALLENTSNEEDQQQHKQAAPPMLASLADDQSVKLWNLRTGQLQNVLSFGCACRHLVALRGSNIAMVCGGKQLLLIDVKTIKKECVYQFEETITSLIYSDSYGQIFAGDAVGNILVLQATSGTSADTSKNNSQPQFISISNRSQSGKSPKCLTPKSTTSHSSSSFNFNQFTLVRKIEKYSTRNLDGLKGSVVSLCLLEAPLLASGTNQSELKIWNYKTGSFFKALETSTTTEITATIPTTASEVPQKTYHVILKHLSQQNMLVTGCSNKCVKFWDISKGRETKRIMFHNPISFAFFIDQNLLAIADGNKIRVFDLKTWQSSKTERFNAPISYICPLESSPTCIQKAIYAICNKDGQIWGQEIKIPTLEDVANVGQSKSPTSSGQAEHKVPPIQQVSSRLPAQVNNNLNNEKDFSFNSQMIMLQQQQIENQGQNLNFSNLPDGFFEEMVTTDRFRESVAQLQQLQNHQQQRSATPMQQIIHEVNNMNMQLELPPSSSQVDLFKKKGLTAAQKKETQESEIEDVAAYLENKQANTSNGEAYQYNQQAVFCSKGKLHDSAQIVNQAKLSNQQLVDVQKYPDANTDYQKCGPQRPQYQFQDQKQTQLMKQQQLKQKLKIIASGVSESDCQPQPQKQEIEEEVDSINLSIESRLRLSEDLSLKDITKNLQFFDPVNDKIQEIEQNFQQKLEISSVTVSLIETVDNKQQIDNVLIQVEEKENSLKNDFDDLRQKLDQIIQRSENVRQVCEQRSQHQSHSQSQNHSHQQNQNQPNDNIQLSVSQSSLTSGSEQQQQQQQISQQLQHVQPLTQPQSQLQTQPQLQQTLPQPQPQSQSQQTHTSQQPLQQQQAMLPPLPVVKQSSQQMDNNGDCKARNNQSNEKKNINEMSNKEANQLSQNSAEGGTPIQGIVRIVQQQNKQRDESLQTTQSITGQITSNNNNNPQSSIQDSLLLVQEKNQIIQEMKEELVNLKHLLKQRQEQEVVASANNNAVAVAPIATQITANSSERSLEYIETLKKHLQQNSAELESIKLQKRDLQDLLKNYQQNFEFQINECQKSKITIKEQEKEIEELKMILQQKDKLIEMYQTENSRSLNDAEKINTNCSSHNNNSHHSSRDMQSQQPAAVNGIQQAVVEEIIQLMNNYKKTEDGAEEKQRQIITEIIKRGAAASSKSSRNGSSRQQLEGLGDLSQLKLQHQKELMKLHQDLFNFKYQNGNSGKEPMNQILQDDKQKHLTKSAEKDKGRGPAIATNEQKAIMKENQIACGRTNGGGSDMKAASKRKEELRSVPEFGGTFASYSKSNKSKSPNTKKFNQSQNGNNLKMQQVPATAPQLQQLQQQMKAQQ